MRPPSEPSLHRSLRLIYQSVRYELRWHRRTSFALMAAAGWTASAGLGGSDRALTAAAVVVPVAIVYLLRVSQKSAKERAAARDDVLAHWRSTRQS